MEQQSFNKYLVPTMCLSELSGDEESRRGPYTPRVSNQWWRQMIANRQRHPLIIIIAMEEMSKALENRIIDPLPLRGPRMTSEEGVLKGNVKNGCWKKEREEYSRQEGTTRVKASGREGVEGTERNL